MDTKSRSRQKKTEEWEECGMKKKELKENEMKSEAQSWTGIIKTKEEKKRRQLAAWGV